MNRIGVLYNPLAQASVDLSLKVMEWVQARGIAVWRGVSQEGRETPEAIGDLDLLVALGGDGTVLRAARLAIASGGVPVLPVALGHLNFMAELQPAELYDGLTTLLDGGGWHDERALLEASVCCRADAPRNVLALNEIVVARAELNRVMVVEVEIHNAPLTTYHCDGVIVATATGSTAYALAAGGPIIDPRSQALVLVPIAPHLTTVRSFVLHEDTLVRLHLQSRYAAAFSADGRENVPLHEGDVVEVRRATQTCVFARVQPPSTFYARMSQRLHREV